MQPSELAIFRDRLQQGYEPLARYIAQATMSEKLQTEFAALALFELYSEVYLSLTNVSENPQMYQAYDLVRSVLDGRFIGIDTKTRIPPRHWLNLPFQQRQIYEVLPGEHSGIVSTLVEEIDSDGVQQYLRAELILWGGLRIQTESDSHDTGGRHGSTSRSQARGGHETKSENIAMKPTHLNFAIKRPHEEKSPLFQARIVYDNQKSKIYLASCQFGGENISVRPELKGRERSHAKHYTELANSLGALSNILIRNVPSSRI